MAAASPPTTPTTSRPLLGRILRSHTKNKRSQEKERESPKIIGFFNVRKRLSPVYDDAPDFWKKRRGTIITDAHATTPLIPYPADSPLSSIESYFQNDCIPSPPKRPRLSTALGVFDVLGKFEQYDFLASLPVSHLSKLALTSHEWAQNITTYISSNSFKKRFITSANNSKMSPDSEDPFTATGQVFKAITVSKLTVERVLTVIRFVESVHDSVGSNDGWFRFFFSVCNCWAAYEKTKIVRAIKSMNGGALDRVIKSSLVARYGENVAAEMEARKLLRAYFVHPLLSATSNSAEKKEAGFWLSSVLKIIHNIGMQARLCMIIFAPTDITEGKECINWRTLVDEVALSAEIAKARLGPLATGLSALVATKEETEAGFSWRQDEVFNLIEEITTFPVPWSFDNFVAFLMQKGNLLPVAVCTRINHSHREEAGQIINTMKTLMHRWGMNITELLGGPLRYILGTLTRQNKGSFVLSIMDAHLSQLREYLLMGDAAASSYEEEMLSQLAFSTLFNEALSNGR